MIATERDNGEEMFPVVTETGEIVGAAKRSECHNGSKLLHPVVHLHVFNGKGEIFLQKRPDWKDIQPGRWDTAVGGHVDLGENVEQALRREVSEEIGIELQRIEMSSQPSGKISAADLCQDKPDVACALKPYVFESSRERELVYPFCLVYDGEVHPSAETAGGRFWSQEELHEAMGKGILTPNFESEYQKLFG